MVMIQNNVLHGNAHDRLRAYAPQRQLILLKSDKHGAVVEAQPRMQFKRVPGPQSDSCIYR